MVDVTVGVSGILSVGHAVVVVAVAAFEADAIDNEAIPGASLAVLPTHSCLGLSSNGCVDVGGVPEISS